MGIRSLVFGTAALVSLAGAAVTFLWQGIHWLQSETWTKLSLATLLRWVDGRAWARLAHRLPEAYSLLDAVPLSIALVGLAILGYVVMKWGSDR